MVYVLVALTSLYVVVWFYLVYKFLEAKQKGDTYVTFVINLKIILIGLSVLIGSPTVYYILQQNGWIP